MYSRRAPGKNCLKKKKTALERIRLKHSQIKDIRNRMGWKKQFGLEGTFESLLLQLPCNKSGHLLLESGCSEPHQPGLEYFQG